MKMDNREWITLEEMKKRYPGKEKLMESETSKAIRAPSVPLDNGPRFGMPLQEREKFSLRGVVYQVRRVRQNGKLTIKTLGFSLAEGEGERK